MTQKQVNKYRSRTFNNQKSRVEKSQQIKKIFKDKIVGKCSQLKQHAWEKSDSKADFLKDFMVNSCVVLDQHNLAGRYFKSNTPNKKINRTISLDILKGRNFRVAGTQHDEKCKPKTDE